MILNLTNLDQSEIKYKINNYPDGQSDLQLLNAIDLQDNITIKSRFNSFKDLELILCATKAIHNLGLYDVSLYIPYILGARSDRQFAIGGVSYLRDIIAPIINAQNYTTVRVIDPHSYVTQAVINNLVTISNDVIVDFALNSIMKGPGYRISTTVLVSPDAGAQAKIFPIAKGFGFTNVITASKHRDIATGNILSTEVPGLPVHEYKDFIIIDDICDGGRTFIEIAKKIKETFAGEKCGKIYLIVTHGIFSAGYHELQDYFDGIYTTNSVKEIPATMVLRTGDVNELTTGQPNNFVHQLNVF